MKRWLFDLINLYIYSSLHIGLGAAAICFMSQSLPQANEDMPYLWFTFYATVLLYNLHRIIGIKKLEGQPDQGRFKIIRTYWNHILIYAIIALLGSVYFFFKLSIIQWFWLVIPAFVSALYVLPILSKALRLRDLPYIKIFLIAITWSVITVTIPLQNSEYSSSFIALFSLERILFIFAITLPFDWRDEDIDRSTGVKTMVHLLGKKGSVQIALGLLVVCIVILFVLNQMNPIGLLWLFSFALTYIITMILIYWQRDNKSDYIYSGLIDGSILAPFIFYYIISLI